VKEIPSHLQKETNHPIRGSSPHRPIAGYSSVKSSLELVPAELVAAHDGVGCTKQRLLVARKVKGALVLRRERRKKRRRKRKRVEGGGEV
jgi:hypothetical protein